MTNSDLHSALLRPAVVQVLKTVGFNLAKPAVVDTLTDLASRYLLLLASEAAQTAATTHGSNVPTIQDVRLALEKVGALQPQMRAPEEAQKSPVKIDGVLVPFEDLRGVRNFIKWVEGPIHAEIRRVGGLASSESDNVADLAAGMDENEDYVTVIKKRHSKTAEESRYQGTALGKDSEIQPVPIAGGDFETLQQWTARRSKNAANTNRAISANTSLSSSALSTPVEIERSETSD